MKTDLILKFKQNLFSKVIWSSTFKLIYATLDFLKFAISLLIDVSREEKSLLAIRIYRLNENKNRVLHRNVDK